MAGLLLDRRDITQQQALLAFNSAFDELRTESRRDWEFLLTSPTSRFEFDPRRVDRAIGYHVTAKGVDAVGRRIVGVNESALQMGQPSYSFQVVYTSKRFGERTFIEHRGVAIEHLIDHQLELLQGLPGGQNDPAYPDRERRLAILRACADPSRIIQAANPNNMVGKYYKAAIEREANLIANNPGRRSLLPEEDRAARDENWFSAKTAIDRALEFFVPAK